MQQLEKLTIEHIRALRPCYDPIKYIGSDWTGTLIDVLKTAHVPAQDRIWVVTGFLNQKTQRLFAVFCARQILKTLGDCTEALEAIDVAEKYAHCEASAYKLDSAKDRMRTILRVLNTSSAITAQSETEIIACNVACWCAQDYVSAYTHKLISQASNITEGDYVSDSVFLQDQIDELLRMLGESIEAPPLVQYEEK